MNSVPDRASTNRQPGAEMRGYGRRHLTRLEAG
ncbi:hypothetical protein SAMN06298226_2543 [Nitrosovibrio sp. Nv4]|nr:hypothetical protein SAMN06298226_2543 [Nitrosovibrio sp. Nv4]